MCKQYKLIFNLVGSRTKNDNKMNGSCESQELNIYLFLCTMHAPLSFL